MPRVFSFLCRSLQNFRSSLSLSEMPHPTAPLNKLGTDSSTFREVPGPRVNKNFRSTKVCPVVVGPRFCTVVNSVIWWLQKLRVQCETPTGWWKLVRHAHEARADFLDDNGYRLQKAGKTCTYGSPNVG